MPVIAVPILVLVCAVALSALGLRQRRWPALRLAVALGWLGPLPGYISVVGIGSATERELGWALLYYLSFALPSFGTYCFAVGLVLSVLIDRYTREPAPRWARPAAIVAASALAALPLILIDGGVTTRLGRAAVVSAACCAVAILGFSKRLFPVSGAQARPDAGH